MSARNLPTAPQEFADATWADILPYYEDLASRPLDRASAESWLNEWSTLEELLDEARNLAEIAYTVDTTDPAKEAAQLRWSAEIGPVRQEQQVRLAKRLLDSGYSRPDLEQVLKRWRTQIDLFREENLPLLEQLEGLNTQYNKITGSFTVEWDGEEVPLPRLAPYLLSPDRPTRERAFRLQAKNYVERHDELAALFDRQFALRQQIARNAGFASFRDFVFQDYHRFDYTPDDCARFHEAVEQTVVPAVTRLHERRARKMGLDTLRPWDTGPDPEGREPLKPFTAVQPWISRTTALFERLDPVLGGYFRTMEREQLLDLDSRKGKAPGGYCTSLDYRGRPFIFMNAAGVHDDVNTLLHEAGHAFHVFEADALPLSWQRQYGAEIAEVASMAMELLAAPFLAERDGGFYSEADARRARFEHLEGILEILPHIASVDAFQHWIYTSGQGDDAAARDAAWLRIRARFEPSIDWSGLEAERIARWQRQLHIFLYPFYYIEYGIAQLGALQVWRNSLRDPAAALTAYRKALALGGTRPLPELFGAAGARLAFDAATMGELVALIEEQLAALEA